MTKRERYLKALRNQPVDALVWAPNFDYWLQVSRAEGTVPAKYSGMSGSEIVRAMGAYIWRRAAGLKVVLDQSVRETSRDEGTALIHEFETPIGAIREVYVAAEGECRTRFLAEHFVKDLDSLKIRQYVVEATHYEPDYEPTIRALAEVGDDGVVLNSCFCVPFLRFAKLDAGYVNGYYMWIDHRNEVDSLIQAHFLNFLDGCRVLANGPADIIATGDNMDGTMIPPPVFKEYAVPFYQEAKTVVSCGGKIFEGHWCGRTRNLLPLVGACGLDVVEAVVTRPMADIELSEALDILKGDVVLQGGIPAVLVCEEGGSLEDFRTYMEEVILPLRHRKGFILGMSDNVPPNACFSRVEMVSGLIS